MSSFCETCPIRGECNGEIIGARVQTRNPESFDFVADAEEKLRYDLPNLQRVFYRFIVTNEIDLAKRDEGTQTARRMVLIDDQAKESDSFTLLSEQGLTDEEVVAVVAGGINACRESGEESKPGDNRTRRVVECPVPGLYEYWMSNDIADQEQSFVEIE